MPLYEYQCQSCGHRFEQIQKFSDPPASACPNCGGAVEKLLSSPAIQFKGSGWYITDYARSGAKAESGSAKADAAPAGDAPAKSDAASATPKADTPAPATPAASTTKSD